MNTYRKAVTVLALTLVGAGCSEFLSGPGLTENPNNPTQGTPLQQLISVQANMATRMEGQVARCASIFTQQLIGSNNQQLQYCTGYGVTESDISGQMSGFYTGGGLLGLRNIEAAATASGDNFMLGIAKVWEGFAMGTATSVWGDLPYSEAVTQGITSPALDPQQNIYAAVQTVLDEGIAALTAVPGPFSTGAPLFSKVARTHPNGTRRAAVASEDDGAAGGAKLQVSFFDGTNWDNGLGAPFSDAQQLATTLSTPMTMRPNMAMKRR